MQTDDIVKLNPPKQVNWDSFWKEAKETGEEFMKKIKGKGVDAPKK